MEDDAAELVSTIRDAGEAFASFIEGLTDEAFDRRPSADGWSAAELAGHAAEFPVTFAKQAVQLALSPGLSLGRQLDDPGRIAAIERLKGGGPGVAAGLVRAATTDASELLSGIGVEGWGVEGVRIVTGESITARLLVETFVLGHLRLHLAQAKAAATPAS